MRRRSLQLESYGITKDQYQELHYFCRQYGAKKRQLAQMLTIPSSAPRIEIAPDGNGCLTPRAKGRTSDPVGETVIRRENLRRDVNMIEQAAKVASPDLWKYILREVTTNCGLVSLNPPCGRNQFYEARRRFFYILWHERDQMKIGDAGDVKP